MGVLRCCCFWTAMVIFHFFFLGDDGVEMAGDV